MKQYRITSEHLNTDSTDDCALSPDDPIHELKQLQYLAGLGSEHRLQEYKNKNTVTNNITTTAAENARLMREKNIRPGTPEWFQLWFSRPYLTGEPKV
jgi:hypothetical protein